MEEERTKIPPSEDIKLFYKAFMHHQYKEDEAAYKQLKKERERQKRKEREEKDHQESKEMEERKDHQEKERERQQQLVLKKELKLERFKQDSAMALAQYQATNPAMGSTPSIISNTSDLMPHWNDAEPEVWF
ncbi:putative uncharacterized protein DDB_G0271982 [Macrobrachium nipponense]|uniref:putative uncharacterized protein DDB_G0271982 n=1 Tax=Macrobrachium nipponense TaxID=159736 RepID=UPI0030C87A9F